MQLSFSYTFDDYREASRAVLRPTRLPGQQTREWLWVLLTAGAAAMALLIASALIPEVNAAGQIQQTRTSTFLMLLIPFVLGIGGLWSMTIRRAEPADRGSLRVTWLILL